MSRSIVLTFLSTAILLVVVVTSFLAYRLHRQHQNDRAWSIRTSDGIEDAGFVRIGGIDQFISIRGEDKANPVVLVLHGGMATSYVSFTPVFRAWEKHFTVVQWDRRGVGKTHGRNGLEGSENISMERIVSDGIELAELLRERLQKDKIVLLGHSMGSMVGIEIAARRPDLLHAYVGTEQIIDMTRNEAASYQMIRERLRANGNEKALKALERLGPPPYASLKDWGAKQRLAAAADVAYGRLAKGMLPMLLFSPMYSLKDSLDFITGQHLSGSALYDQWMAFDARQFGRSYGTPIIIIQGTDDVMTPSALAQEWLAEISAPRKELILIDGGGHLVMATASEQYLADLVQRVRPLAAAAPGSTF